MQRLPPTSEQQLFDRAMTIAGLTLEELAQTCDVHLPPNLRRDKGFVGQLIEKVLGAYAGCTSQPDFPLLGIELKTIPINQKGNPCETTFVCTIPLLEIGNMSWQDSPVRQKLSRVLWIPIEAEKKIPLRDRHIGMPILWSPSRQQEECLKTDWEELTEMISLGELESITARHGSCLQVRPKAADAKSLCWGVGSSGELVLTLPRGFYLRTQFTQTIIHEHYTFVSQKSFSYNLEKNDSPT